MGSLIRIHFVAGVFASLAVLVNLSPVGAQDKKAPPVPVDAKTMAEISQLIKQLGSDKYNERIGAHKRLLELGEPAVAALRGLSEKEPLETKLRAVKIIQTIEKRNVKPPSDAALAALIAELSHGNFVVRDKASRTLIEIGEPARKALVAAIDSGGDLETRHRAGVILKILDTGGK